jgi:crotonobetainyl-CoA hydratase
MSVLESTQDGVRSRRDGTILEVTLDRPKANTIDLAASRRLNTIFTAFRDDPGLRIAIVTGTGEKFFSPGWDLKAAAQGEEQPPCRSKGRALGGPEGRCPRVQREA